MTEDEQTRERREHAAGATSFVVNVTCADCGLTHPPLAGKLGALVDQMAVARIRVTAPRGWSFNETIALCPTCSEKPSRFYRRENEASK